MELSSEAIFPAIVFFILPMALLLILASVFGRALMAYLNKKSKTDSTVLHSKTLVARLGWRLPLCITSTVTALCSLAITAYSFSAPGFSFVFGLGTGLLLLISAPIAVVSIALLLAKILADMFVSKQK